MVALPAGILASAFSEQLRKRRARYEELVDIAFEDGVLTAKEEETLEYMRLKLGISQEDAREAYRKINKTESANIAICPHCNNLLASNNH